MYSTRSSCHILMRLKFSQQIFEKYSNLIFKENPSSGNWVVWCGRADRHDEANSRFSQILLTRLKTATHNAQTHRLYDSTYALPSYCVVSSWASRKILPFCHHKITEVSVKAKRNGSAAIENSLGETRTYRTELQGFSECSLRKAGLNCDVIVFRWVSLTEFVPE